LGQSITVKAGCNIPTMHHLITADDSEDMEILNSWLNWTMSLSQLFNHDDNVQLTAMITDIRQHINGDFDASQLLKRLHNVQKPFSAEHWRFSSPAAMLGIAILIAVISFAVWKKYCAQASQTATAPPPPAQPLQQQPLPPAPPTVQPQPQIQAPQPQAHYQPPPAPSAPTYLHHNPTFHFSKPMAPVLIYT
jgi:hypothetical protein